MNGDILRQVDGLFWRRIKDTSWFCLMQTEEDDMNEVNFKLCESQSLQKPSLHFLKTL